MLGAPPSTKAAPADRLRDRRIANVPTRVFGAIAREEEAFHDRSGGGEPFVSQSADLYTELCTVAGHRRDNRAVFDSTRGIDDRLG